MIKDFFIKLVILALVLSILTFVGTLMFPNRYRAYNTYFIDATYVSPESSIIDYSPQQLAEKTTDNIKGIIESRNFLGSVLENAGYENNVKTREKLSKKILVKKVGPQVLYVELSGYNNPETLNDYITSISNVLKREVESINQNGSITVSFNTVTESSNVEEIQLYPIINSVVVFFATIILGISFIEFKKYIES